MIATGAGAAARFFPTGSRGRNFLRDREVVPRQVAASFDSLAVGGEASAPPKAPEGSTDAGYRPATAEIGPGKGRPDALAARRRGAGLAAAVDARFVAMGRE